MFSVWCCASQCPLRNAGVSSYKMDCIVVADVRNPGEATAQRLAYRGRSGESLPARRRAARHFQDAVFRKKGHDSVEVVGVERRTDPFKSIKGRIAAAHCLA